MSEKVSNLVNSIKHQDYAGAKSEFQAAMAERINSEFENKKIEIAKNMTESVIEEKKTRQLDDPENEAMVVKDGKVEVIDKKDVDKYMKKGYKMAESTQFNKTMELWTNG